MTSAGDVPYNLSRRTDFVRRVVMPIVRRAAKRALESGWRAETAAPSFTRPPGTGARWCSGVEVSRGQDLRLTAGSLSPYLMRVVNQLDPMRYPPPTFVAAHAQTEWFQGIAYDEDHHGPAVSADPEASDPLADDVGQAAAPVRLGPDSAAEWIEARVRHLIQRTTPLLSDQALRDWLLAQRWPDGDVWPAGSSKGLHVLRCAILLTRHLGGFGET